MVDANGTVVPDAEPSVTFLIAGPAALAGHNRVNAEAGVASLLLQSGDEAGPITSPRAAAE